MVAIKFRALPMAIATLELTGLLLTAHFMPRVKANSAGSFDADVPSIKLHNSSAASTGSPSFSQQSTVATKNIASQTRVTPAIIAPQSTPKSRAGVTSERIIRGKAISGRQADCARYHELLPFTEPADTRHARRETCASYQSDRFAAPAHRAPDSSGPSAWRHLQ